EGLSLRQGWKGHVVSGEREPGLNRLRRRSGRAWRRRRRSRDRRPRRLGGRRDAWRSASPGPAGGGRRTAAPREARAEAPPPRPAAAVRRRLLRRRGRRAPLGLLARRRAPRARALHVLRQRRLPRRLAAPPALPAAAARAGSVRDRVRARRGMGAR